MKVLLSRFGGIGDAFPTMVAAQNLHKQGHEVTIALRDDGGQTKQSVMFSNQEQFKFLDYSQVGPWQSRVVDHEGGLIELPGLYKNYDLVVDFMNIIEGNSTSPVNNVRVPWEFWQRSRSSNYQNWYDLHLAWCNINPDKVSAEDKRPKLVLTQEEIETSESIKSGVSKLFVIHPFASSLARSWYQAEKLVDPLLKEYDGAGIAFWNPQRQAWDLISSKGRNAMPRLGFHPLRDTMALVNASDLVIGVDTGCGHIAEALDKKSLIIYSTVPASTRNKYYKFQSHFDAGEENPEYHTFSLGLGDPLRVKEGVDGLSDREKELKAFLDRRAPMKEIMEALNTDSRGVELESKMLRERVETWERIQSKALSDIKPDKVFDRIKGIIND